MANVPLYLRIDDPSCTSLTNVLTKVVSPPPPAPSISSITTHVGLLPFKLPFIFSAVDSRAFLMRSVTTLALRSSEAFTSSTW